MRTKSRLSLSIYTFPNNPRLHVSFEDRKDKYVYRSDDKIAPNQVCQVAVVWDGERVRVYVDGLLRNEGRQPVAMQKVGDLNIGPYKDGWLAPKPWGNDSFAGELRTWNHPLAQDEIAALCGAKTQDVKTAFPQTLVVPRRVGAAAPKLDGALSDPMWSRAASMAGLCHGKTPEKSGELPPNKFLATYDDENLYIGFSSLLPGRVPVKTGAVRTPDKEPEVWGDESFEFYVEADGQLYRFAGNVAGGYTEWKGSDSRWDGAWTYKSFIKMQIDDRQLWRGEASIPWKTLGLSGAPKSPLKFNFCRTWRLPETSTHSSLLPEGQYNQADDFPTMVFAEPGPVMQVLEQNNPAQGRFEQKLQFLSPSDSNVNYNVSLVKADGSAAPLVLGEKVVSLRQGVPVAETLQMQIASTAYDRIVHTLSEGKRTLMRQVVPFKLNEEYMSVALRFLSEQVVFDVKNAMLKGKFGADFAPELVINAPDGSVFKSLPVDKDQLVVGFPRASQKGVYSARLAGKDGKGIYSLTFNYPGVGEWEKITFDNRIIPPFTPLETKSSTGAMSSSMWGRTYSWDKSLFPVSMKSRGVEMLAAPVTLEANGRVVSNAALTPGKSEPHRAELAAEAGSADCSVRNSSWVEYDGVQWNEVKLKAVADLKDVRLKIPMPAALAKYVHTSDATTSWGCKITEAVAEGVKVMRFYPTVWIGMEDKGLCFFAESRHSWRSSAKETFRIVKDGKTAVLEVSLAGKIAKGEEFAFEFGLLSSPVRPQASNYPLNTFSYSFAAPMNRQGRAPASWSMIINTWPNELGGYFGDLPSPEKSDTLRLMRKDTENIHKFGGRAIPYTCDRYLSEEYPEAVAFKDEWKISPELSLDYMRDGRKLFIYDCCPASGANAFFMTKVRRLFQLAKVDGIYFDFGLAPVCNNEMHGCKERVPLLGQREFYRRVILCQLDAGVKDPVIVLHNTDAVQLPAMTFATHLFNGEHIRQSSSTIMHDGKDILDTYGVEMFASELNSLPFGLNNAVYQSNDVLLKEFGGGKEDPDLYKFRITRAMIAGTVVHNTLPALNRCHFGIFDKIIRAYERFDVPKAAFLGYWEKPATVTGAADVYVSVYKHATEKRALAVVSHIGKSHDTRQVEISFDLSKLGFTPGKASDLMTAPDSEYAELSELLRKHNVPPHRTPLKLGDFGSKIMSAGKGSLKLSLDAHCFSIIELSE